MNKKGGKNFKKGKHGDNHSFDHNIAPVVNKIDKKPVKKVILNRITDKTIKEKFEKLSTMELASEKKAVICHTDPMRWVIIDGNSFAIVEILNGCHVCLDAWDVSDNPEFKEKGFRLRKIIITISKLVFTIEKLLPNGKVSELGTFAIEDDNQDELKIVMKGQHPEIEFKH